MLASPDAKSTPATYAAADNAAQLHEQRTQIARLLVFLSWAIPIISSFGVLELLAFAYLGDIRSGATGVVIFGYIGALIVARARLNHGALQAAVTLTWSGILVAALVIVLIQPALSATLALIPLLAVAVALPYLQGRSLRRLIALCWLTVVFIAVIGEVARPISLLPPWFSSLFHISSLAAAAALVLLLLQQFSSRLTETLLQTRAANAELRESEERYRVVAETAADAIITIDQNSSIQFANHAAERIFGYSVAELAGQSITMLMPARLRRDHTLALRRYLANGVRGFSWEGIALPGLHKTGVEIPLEVSFGEFHQHGNRLFTGIIRDIAERKRAEEQRIALERTLLEAQKLESLGVLAGGIAHDFNNLLAVVIGNAELSMADLPAESPQRDSLVSILSAARRAASLTQQMLAYSGKGNFIVQRLDLNALLADMHDLLHSLTFGAVQLALRLSPEPLLIEGDLTQLRQLIINLLTNAAEAIAGHSGQIVIATGVRNVDRAYLAQAYLAPSLPEGQYAYLEISDSGRGMDEDTLARIFEPFFTTKFVGRGLGLPAALGIVRAHQGALIVESRPNHGSTFTILLACIPDIAPPAPAPPAPWQPGAAAGTVLVVDDEEGVRLVIQRTLQRLGLKVLTAADGRSGVELFRSHADQISCVLLDLMMPLMNGEEALVQIRSIRPDVPVILISGYDEREVIGRFDSQRPSGFLQKPFSPAMLRDMVQRFLSEEAMPHV